MSPAIISGIIFGGIVGGISGGVAVFVWALMQSPKTCPDCDTPLPKFRRPENNQQRMWGGWTCPNCSCDIDRKGKRRQPK